ncbi:HEPN family nuclease, partial [Escherichia coli]
KTSIFSHPVYLFLRKFSLQDSRGGSMRNSVAHFSVQVISVSDEHLVDLIAFRDDPEDENAYATFSAPELLSFLKYYTAQLLGNMARRRAPAVNAVDL